MSGDTFHELARHYDALMDEIDYDRWLVVASYLRDLVDEPDPLHLDIACGTGKFLKRVREHGWRSFGVDNSAAMVRLGARGPHPGLAAVADMTALPHPERFGFVTCLFDSLNFLMQLDALRRAAAEAFRVLRPGGLYYCDTITERMVTKHFAGRKWQETHGKMRADWAGEWEPDSGKAELRIRVNTGAENIIRERVYSDAAIRGALENAGFEVLGYYDADGWKKPNYKTLRIDWVAAKPPAPEATRAFNTTREAIRAALR